MNLKLICPICENVDSCKDYSDAEWIECKCSKCACEFDVNISTVNNKSNEVI
jgi:hypothetical protein